jgi:hypothetical protein
VSNIIQTEPVNERILEALSRRLKVALLQKHVGLWVGVMLDSRRYRRYAAECFLAARKASEPYYRQLNLSMAASWLSLAAQDEAMNRLFAIWDAVEYQVPQSRTATTEPFVIDSPRICL